MMVNKDRLFRTDIARAGNVRVNRENNVISGFAVVSKGVTKDARGEFDDQALERIVELGNKSKIGIKSRFGHPNMSSTALGTFLGRAKNFRRDDDIVRADLNIDKTAHNTPDGNLAAYVMDLAESDPDAFGSSMVIHWEEELRKKKDQDGNLLPPFIRVRKLSSVDIVDDPAANEGFFGMPFFSDSVKPSAEMTTFLDRFVEQPGAVEKVVGFLDRYRTNSEQLNQIKEGKTMFEELTVDKLKAERRDVFDSVHSVGVEEGKNEGFEDGRKLERERVISILKKASEFKDMQTIAIVAVEEGQTLDQATIKFQEKQLEGLKNASPENPGPDGEDQKNKIKKSHLERAKEYKFEHSCSMTDALKATAE